MSLSYDLRCGTTVIEGLSAAQLKGLTTAERLKPTDFIKKSESLRWTQADAVPGIAEHLSRGEDLLNTPDTLEREIDVIAFDLGFEAHKSRSDDHVMWQLRNSDGVSLWCALAGEAFAAQLPVLRLRASQLDDPRLLERLLRLGANTPIVGIGLDEDDEVVIRCTRGTADLDASEIRTTLLALLRAYESMAEKVSHLL